MTGVQEDTRVVEPRNKKNPHSPIRRWVVASGLTCAGLTALVGVPLSYEATHYVWQSDFFGKMARGESNTVMVTDAPIARGPKDQRLDYAHIPERVAAVEKKGGIVSPQASYALNTFMGIDLYPAYEKKMQAGLHIKDAEGETLRYTPYPAKVYPSLESVAPAIWKTLCSIEDKEVCDPDVPANANPAFNGPRTAKAIGQKLHVIPGQPSVSTLLAQSIKYDHSPGGNTVDPVTGKKSDEEKIRQWLTGSRDVYANGSDTRETRKHIILYYLNSAPYAATPAHGEIHGLPLALEQWFGIDFEAANKALMQPQDKMDDAQLQEVADLYRKVLTLQLSLKMGHKFLRTPDGFKRLQERVDNFVTSPSFSKKPLLEEEVFKPLGFSPRFAAMVARSKIDFNDLARHDISPEGPGKNEPRHKAVDAVRVATKEWISYPGDMHDMDKIDLTVTTTLRAKPTRDVRNILHSFYNPEEAKKRGMTGVGEHLADPDRLDDIIYGAIFYEIGKNTNDLLFESDTNPGWLNVSSGTGMQMGSTLKAPITVAAMLRVHRAYEKYANKPPEELRAELGRKRGPFTDWTLRHLLNETSDKSIEGLLNAALDKTYSNNPGRTYITGGGPHTFKNYKPDHNGRTPALRDCLAKSYNLCYINVMADIEQEDIIEEMHISPDIFTNPDDPDHVRLLKRHADAEGQDFQKKAWRLFDGKTPDQIASMLSHRMDKKSGTVKPLSPPQLMVVYRMMFPNASLEQAIDYLRTENLRHGPERAHGKFRDIVKNDLAASLGLPLTLPQTERQNLLKQIVGTYDTKGDLQFTPEFQALYETYEQHAALAHPNSESELGRLAFILRLVPKSTNAETQADLKRAIETIATRNANGSLVPAEGFKKLVADFSRETQKFKDTYNTYSPENFTVERKKDPAGKINYLSLMDRGFMTGIHELHLVVAAYQANSPTAQALAKAEAELKITTLSEVQREKLIQDAEALRKKLWSEENLIAFLKATEAERTASYEWLLAPRRKIDPATGIAQIKPGTMKGRNKRVFNELQKEAFEKHLYRDLVAMGYSFPPDNPSYAWVLGSAPNTMANLATFLNLIQHDGIKYPNRTIVKGEYAVGVKTFYRQMLPANSDGERVLPVEIAQVMKQVLEGTAENGTMTSIRHVLEDGYYKGGKLKIETPRYLIGGKTGTSRNQIFTLGKGGSKSDAISTSLTGTAIIIITDTVTGKKYVCVTTAYVEGQKSAKHHFNSGIALKVFQNLAPVIKEMIEKPSLVPSVAPVLNSAASPATVQPQQSPGQFRIPVSQTFTTAGLLPLPSGIRIHPATRPEFPPLNDNGSDPLTGLSIQYIGRIPGLPPAFGKEESNLLAEWRATECHHIPCSRALQHDTAKTSEPPARELLQKPAP